MYLVYYCYTAVFCNSAQSFKAAKKEAEQKRKSPSCQVNLDVRWLSVAVRSSSSRGRRKEGLLLSSPECVMRQKIASRRRRNEAKKYYYYNDEDEVGKKNESPLIQEGKILADSQNLESHLGLIDREASSRGLRTTRRRREGGGGQQKNMAEEWKRLLSSFPPLISLSCASVARSWNGLDQGRVQGCSSDYYYFSTYFIIYIITRTLICTITLCPFRKCAVESRFHCTY